LNADTLATVVLSDYLAPGLGATLNGVGLSDADLKAGFSLFPGSYELGLSNPYLGLAGNTFTVTNQADFSGISRYSNIVLSNDAGTLLVNAAQAKLDACMVAHEINPANCGWRMSAPSEGTPDLSTLTATVTSSNLSSATWTLATTTYLQASATVSISLALSLYDTAGSHYTGSISLSSVLVDFADPNNPRVIFN